VRVSTHITSSVSAPRAHRPNAAQGGATPASTAILISAKLEPQTAERSTKPGSQARDERAGERVIGTALASGRDRRRTPVVPPTGRPPGVPSAAIRVGAGATWAQVVTAAAAHGLAPLCASSTAVGVAGSPSAGMGPLGRRHGFAAAVQQAVDPDGMFARTPRP
jgi:hypothetical protein